MEEDGDGPSIVRLTIRIIYMIVNFLWITQLYFISGKIVQKVKKAQKKKIRDNRTRTDRDYF